MLHALNPKTVLEYGPGESTKIFQAHESIKLIDSIEHSPGWEAKLDREKLFKMEVILEPKHYKYPYVMGRCDSYDAVFVDGIERPACISLAKFRLSRSGFVVVHDAERLEYKQAYELWGMKFFVDQGHTVFLTNEIVTANTLAEILG